jgi:hypothetical protein
MCGRGMVCNSCRPAPVMLPEREESEPLWLPERSGRPLPDRRPGACLAPPLPPAMCGALPRPNLLLGAMPSERDALRHDAETQDQHGFTSMAHHGILASCCDARCAIPFGIRVWACTPSCKLLRGLSSTRHGRK